MPDRAARSRTASSRAEAALLKPPVHPPLKSRDDYTIVGKSTPRIDIPSKVNGSATYGVDVTLPQMLYATVAASPVFGAKLVSVDSAPAEALPGVKKVVKLENAVAVVADGYWRALKGVRALAPKFEDTPQRRGDERHDLRRDRRCARRREERRRCSRPARAATLCRAPRRSSKRSIASRSSRTRPWSR